MNKKDIVVDKSKKLLEIITDAGFSYSRANKMLRNKDVRLNGKVCKENVKVELGNVVTIFFKDEAKKYEIVFENLDCLIINKFSNTEVNEEFSKTLGVFLVHRLDRNTEGLLVLAKNENAKIKLENAFKNHLVRKFYLAEVVGRMEVDKMFSAYLIKDSEKSIVKIYPNKVKNSVLIQTKIKTLKANDESSLLEVEIISGKTHQIRAHLAFLGHAIIGDGKYGKREDLKKFKLSKQCLFAYKLIFGQVGLQDLDGKEFKILPDFVKNITNLNL